MTQIVVATEKYAFNHMSAIMAAKLLSMKTGIPMVVRNSDYLLRLGLKPYVPAFLVESDAGSAIMLKSGCSSRHWEVMRQLENALRDLRIT